MKRLFFIAVFITLFSTAALAEGEGNPAEGTAPSGKRPKVGLVLAGGGAKGSAHIGVLKYIEEMGIPIDYVAGTSMGSIIGGLYALGYTPIEMDSLISNMDWSIYMSDHVDRKNMGYGEKISKSTYLLTVPFNTGGLRKTMNEKREQNKNEEEKNLSFISSLPSGFISGQNLLNLFNDLSVGYQDSIDFNNLPIPYACVATNIVTGKPKVFRSGIFPLAMRASMAIPGVFSPVRMGNEVLVDGGMMNNFPVDVCREMGADIVIGVEVNEGMKGDPDKLNSLPELLDQLMSIVTSGELVKNRELCDIYIHPSVKGYGTMSFDKTSIDSLIQRGYKEATRHESELRDLKAKMDAAGRKREPYKHPAAKNLAQDTIMISSVEMKGISEKDGMWLLRKTELLSGKPVTGKDIDEAIAVFYGMNCFSAITYQLKGESSPYHLVFNFQNKAPHRFGLGFRFDSEETAAILLGVGFNTQKMHGVSFDVSGRLSYNPWGKALISFSALGIPKFNVGYTFRKSSLDLYNSGKADISTLVYKHNVQAYFSESYSKNVHFQVGVEYEQYRMRHLLTNWSASYEAPITKADEEPAEGDGNSVDVGNYFGVYANIFFDNQDQTFFATRGIKFEINGEWMPGIFKTNLFKHFGTVRGKFLANLSPCKYFTIIPQLYFSTLIGPINPLPYVNLLGGSYEGRYFEQQLPFIGINHPEVGFGTLGILRLDLRGQVAKKQYVMGIVNYGRDAFTIQEFFKTNNNMWGAAVGYAYDSAIGPISLNVHWSNLTKKVGLYFNLGYYF